MLLVLGNRCVISILDVLSLSVQKIPNQFPWPWNSLSFMSMERLPLFWPVRGRRAKDSDEAWTAAIKTFRIKLIENSISDLNLRFNKSWVCAAVQDQEGLLQ